MKIIRHGIYGGAEALLVMLARFVNRIFQHVVDVPRGVNAVCLTRIVEFDFRDQEAREALRCLIVRDARVILAVGSRRRVCTV